MLPNKGNKYIFRQSKYQWYELLDNSCFAGVADRNNGGHSGAGVAHQSHSHNLMKGKPKKYTNEQIQDLEGTASTKCTAKIIPFELSENLNRSERHFGFGQLFGFGKIRIWFQEKPKIRSR